MWLVLCWFCWVVGGRVLDIVEFGAVADDPGALVTNAKALAAALGSAQPGDTVLVPGERTFYCLGGIRESGLKGVTIDLSGELVAVPDVDNWPFVDGGYLHFLQVLDSEGISVQGHGCIKGEGLLWWNKVVFPIIYGPLKGERPKLVVFTNCTDITIRDVQLHDSPSWHLVLDDVARVEVANLTITVNRSDSSSLPPNEHAPPPDPGLQPEDLNTDGIDVSGRDVWIHDSYVQNDDDSVAIKPCSGNCVHSDCTENILIERTTLTGFGASIGSVPPSGAVNCVRNITFRNIEMPYTGKGIYIKSNPSCDGSSKGIISDIVYENIRILYPRWWAIWIGPQQQHQPGTPLGDKCPLDYPITPTCPTQGCVDFRNITLRNVFVESPWLSPGVILGNSTNPIQNLVFDNVTVNNPGAIPFDYQYHCEYTTGYSINSNPVPPCLTPQKSI